MVGHLSDSPNSVLLNNIWFLRSWLKWIYVNRSGGYLDAQDQQTVECVLGILTWHHRFNGHKFEQAPGVGNRQGGLVCCSPWGHRDRRNWVNELNWTELSILVGQPWFSPLQLSHHSPSISLLCVLINSVINVFMRSDLGSWSVWLCLILYICRYVYEIPRERRWYWTQNILLVINVELL